MFGAFWLTFLLVRFGGSFSWPHFTYSVPLVPSYGTFDPLFACVLRCFYLYSFWSPGVLPWHAPFSVLVLCYFGLPFWEKVDRYVGLVVCSSVLSSPPTLSLRLPVCFFRLLSVCSWCVLFFSFFSFSFFRLGFQSPFACSF